MFSLFYLNWWQFCFQVSVFFFHLQIVKKDRLSNKQGKNTLFLSFIFQIPVIRIVNPRGPFTQKEGLTGGLCIKTAKLLFDSQQKKEK